MEKLIWQRLNDTQLTSRCNGTNMDHLVVPNEKIIPDRDGGSATHRELVEVAFDTAGRRTSFKQGQGIEELAGLYFNPKTNIVKLIYTSPDKKSPVTSSYNRGLTCIWYCFRDSTIRMANPLRS